MFLIDTDREDFSSQPKRKKNIYQTGELIIGLGIGNEYILSYYLLIV